VRGPPSSNYFFSPSIVHPELFIKRSTIQNLFWMASDAKNFNFAGAHDLKIYVVYTIIHRLHLAPWMLKFQHQNNCWYFFPYDVQLSDAHGGTFVVVPMNFVVYPSLISRICSIWQVYTTSFSYSYNFREISFLVSKFGKKEPCFSKFRILATFRTSDGLGIFLMQVSI
jgi:hypothetical protein